MILGKKTLFSLLLGFDLLTNVLMLAHINVFYTTTLLSFCNCILLPGLLISLSLRIKKISLWENLIIIIGLSLAFLECGGLLLNILLSAIGVNAPLTFQTITIGFNVAVVILFILAWIRTRRFAIQMPGLVELILGDSPAKSSVPGQFVKPGFIDSRYEQFDKGIAMIPLQFQLPVRSMLEKGLYLLPLSFPLLAALGAIRLNNGGSNILTLILLGLIACYGLLLLIFRDKISIDIYPYALFFIALAILFTTSLRSWYITGHDIEREFYVFQLTNQHHMWNMAFFQDPYNACLSITILPTVLTHLLSIQDMYVYKVIFQILFATSPVLVFFIIKNYTMPIFAFLSAFFFMAFPTFFNDMPMLNRQEIGFIFFGLVLYMMLIAKLPTVMRKSLFLLFALGVIISHYSTNFVLLALVVFVYVFTLIMSRPFVQKTGTTLLTKAHIKLKNTFPNRAFLSIPLIVMLFLMTYGWNSLYTNSSNHTGSVITQVIGGLFVQSKSSGQSGDLSYSIFSSSKTDPQKKLQEYIQGIVQSAEADAARSGQGNASQFYSKAITDKYPTYPIPQEKLALTPIGNVLSSLHIPVFNLQAELRSLSAAFMQIFIFIGLLIVFFFRTKSSLDLQFLLLCVGGLFLLGLITVLPTLSVEYGVLRMFQQLLFLLSLPIVLGLNSVFFFVKEQKRILFTGIIAILFFLNLTGFIAHLTGDYYPQLTLDNAGSYYDAYYVHKSDVLAIVWLSNNDANNEPVEADLSGGNKLLTYGGKTALSEIFPAVIRRNAYVYLEVSSHVEVSIDKDVLIYNSSQHFLDDNKNLIYSNGKNNIYK